jgi:hypothetical protein
MTTVRNTAQKPRRIRFLSIAVAAGAVFGIMWSCGVFDRMPSDADLQRKFYVHQSDFGKLVQMSDADPHVTLIRSNLTRLDTDWSWPRRDVGFSNDRWNEYRWMFRELEVKGLSRTQTGSVAVIVYASGGALGGSEKGLVYSAHPLTPLSSSLDQFPRELYNRNRGYALVYKPLGGNWYMYRTED